MLGVSIIVFLLIHMSGDPIALLLPPEASPEAYDKLRAELGFDKPLHIQYWVFITNALQGEFGMSLRWNRPCIQVFAERFPNTVQLATASMVWALCIGISVGILSSVKAGSWFDGLARVLALLGQATPVFWLGIMLMMVFSVNLRLLPTSGMGSIKNLIMPSVTLGTLFAAGMMRLTRSTMLDVLDSEYIKMARIKGVRERMVINKHAFKNAMLPVLTMVAMNFVFLLNGTVITESIFNWPGVGRLVVESIFARDYATIQTVVLLLSGLFVFANLIVDVLYAYIDPRIKYGNRS
jgi:peptide/nickel transport system permease protein